MWSYLTTLFLLDYALEYSFKKFFPIQNDRDILHIGFCFFFLVCSFTFRSGIDFSVHCDPVLCTGTYVTSAVPNQVSIDHGSLFEVTIPILTNLPGS